jgi:hypothetical protein
MSQSSNPTGSNSSSAPSVADLLSDFEKFAQDNAGSPVTSVRYVLTTRALAQAAYGQNDADPSSQGANADLPALLLVADGNFVANAAHRPPHEAAPTGTSFFQVVDPDTGFVMTWGVAKTAPTLTGLGAVHTVMP